MMGMMVPPPDSVTGTPSLIAEACISCLQITRAAPGDEGSDEKDVDAAIPRCIPSGSSRSEPAGTHPSPTTSGTTTRGNQQRQPQKDFEDQEVDVGAVEAILNYVFRDRGLVTEALTHRSYHFPEKHGICYERLEFVGDAVLNCLVAKELFSMYPCLQPGRLTRLRAANVDTEKLARAAVDKGLHRLLRHKAPFLKSQIEEFMGDMTRYPIHSNGLADPPKVLADIVESLLGAVFKDSDGSLPIVWQVFKRSAEPLITVDTLGQHPVSELYELCQKRRLNIKFQDTWVQNTKIHVLVDGNLIGSAAYKHKKEIAHNRAAKAALDHLKLLLDRTHLEGETFLDTTD